jgi:type II secretory pathway predicted ATPase ExeA
LKPVGHEPDLVQFGKALSDFCKLHNLSWRELERICGGASAVSKSTLQRMASGSVTRKTTATLQPLILDKLRQYLRDKHYPTNKINGQLTYLCVPVSPRAEGEQADYSGLGSWGLRLEAFRVQHGLSFNKLWGACGGKLVSSLNTLKGACEGGNVYQEQRLKTEIPKHLRRFLELRGKTPEEAKAEVEKIFGEMEDDMIAQRATLPAEIQRHFGLKRDPFTGDPLSKAEVFTTPQLDRVAAKVEDAINYAGFLVVTGEIGSGKTMLKRRVVDTVARTDGRLRLLWPEFFNMDRVHSGSIVTFLLASFNQTVPGDLVARAAKLKRVLADANGRGERVAIGFDECHHLDDRLLTALKNFWELGEGYDRFVGVVLFGQPQFEGRLRDAKFREIVERIEVVQMPTFEKVAWDYVAHRVRVAGGDAEKLFERETVRLLAKHAKTPLALGNVCNSALLKAHKLGLRKVPAEILDLKDHGEPQVRAVRKVS